jgi:hypothetical protein
MKSNQKIISLRKCAAERAVFVLIMVVGLSGLRTEWTLASDANRSPGNQDLSTLVKTLTPDNWEISNDVMLFTPESLYDLIDGAADFYLAYGMVELTFATFINSGDKRQYIELSIYDMGEPANAFGVFSAECSQGKLSLDLGRAAYSSGADYYIWKGQYYMTIIASESTADLKRIASDLARKTTSTLKDSDEPVWGLTALPKADLVADSVKYFKADAMGLDFMQDTYTGSYHKGQTEITVFLSQKESPGSAQDTVTRYAMFAKENGNGFESFTQDGIDLVLCDMINGFDVIFRKGRFVAGVLSVTDRGQAVQYAVDFWRQL